MKLWTWHSSTLSESHDRLWETTTTLSSECLQVTVSSCSSSLHIQFYFFSKGKFFYVLRRRSVERWFNIFGQGQKVFFFSIVQRFLLFTFLDFTRTRRLRRLFEGSLLPFVRSSQLLYATAESTCYTTP